MICKIRVKIKQLPWDKLCISLCLLKTVLYVGIGRLCHLLFMSLFWSVWFNKCNKKVLFHLATLIAFIFLNKGFFLDRLQFPTWFQRVVVVWFSIQTSAWFLSLIEISSSSQIWRKQIFWFLNTGRASGCKMSLMGTNGSDV